MSFLLWAKWHNIFAAACPTLQLCCSFTLCSCSTITFDLVPQHHDFLNKLYMTTYWNFSGQKLILVKKLESEAEELLASNDGKVMTAKEAKQHSMPNRNVSVCCSMSWHWKLQGISLDAEHVELCLHFLAARRQVAFSFLCCDLNLFSGAILPTWRFHREGGEIHVQEGGAACVWPSNCPSTTRLECHRGADKAH